MRRNRWIGWLLVAVVTVMMTACGGGGGSVGLSDQQKAINLIVDYAESNGTSRPKPNADTYKTAGAELANDSDLDDINAYIASLGKEDVDASDGSEIKDIADHLGVHLVDTDSDGTPDYADTDDDGDGTPDVDEIANGTNPLVNEPPVANAGEDIQSNEGESVVLDGAGSHDDGSTALTFEWTVIGAPAGADFVLSGASTDKPQLSANTPGEYTFGLVVNDGNSDSGTDSVKVAILETALVYRYTEEYGNEPWITNGTPEGTKLLKDINPSTQGSFHRNSYRALGSAVLNGFYYFVVNDADGDVLWKSDGTEGGTSKVYNTWSVGNPVAFKDKLYFYASSDKSSGGMMESDGIAGGTHEVGLHSMRYPVVVDNILYYLSGKSLWKFDGTTETEIKQITDSGRKDLKYLTNVSGRLYFYAKINESKGALWTSDGTAGNTVMLNDNYKTGSTSEPQEFTAMNGVLYFVARTADEGRELWKSEGTSATTVLVKDIVAGTGSSNPKMLTVVDGTLYFSVNRRALWKSNGTEVGTTIVKDDIHPRHIATMGGDVYFFGSDVVHGWELWKSDGTPGGTQMVKDIVTGDKSSIATSYYERGIGVTGNTLYFTVNDGVHGNELWISDGTPDGTVILKDINEGIFNADPKKMVNVDGTLYFVADDAQHGFELWRSEGTAETTTLVKDINTKKGESFSRKNKIIKRGSYYYFIADDGRHGQELWTSDGTTEGTVLVKDAYAGTPGVDKAYWRYSGSYLVDMDGMIYFAAHDRVHGAELWKSDGTPDGTELVKDIYGGRGNSKLRYLVNIDGTLYFSATTDGHGNDLWKSDGTLGGTELVKEIGEGWNNPLRFTNVNGTLYFGFKRQIWKSDGTPANTAMVKDGVSYPRVFTAVGDKLFFESGGELWVSTGTEEGTHIVKDINEGGFAFDFHSRDIKFATLNDELYCIAYDGTSGKIWKSNGTEEGTTSLSGTYDYLSGHRLMGAGDHLYFLANTVDDKYSLWGSDGTNDGAIELTSKLEKNSIYMKQAMGDSLLFTIQKNLWITDGTEEGTKNLTP